ncbi:Stk1 family PASTA domain-containing Ser/Thr kinase [Natroniella sulfidigena]|uniref:Stk1 family PASTA domain-containing Ser/Thr kinase n=1 Tax=Natroniella sulfidigena TaxID=723921 RepID=UPI00200A256E|nr:Stk1 family PASTA domain-containing Ser/Thr kinase [Natroniella sulfidigena]MCK8817814.1 Stk1 family PASTA domain-containing Ser/Thr kinase [Natroniella sulfidigena]
MIGKVLNNRYELLEKIGTGGMAVVYLAQDKLLSREVAVKILQPQFADDVAAVERFRHEAQAVASFSHQNIVNIYDIAKDGDFQYIIMEHVEGQNLKEKVKQSGKLPLEEAVKIAQEVCQALITAHRNNIVHCDIKPHNILLTSEGKAKVTDFGIAQAITSATVVQTESIVGSAHYLSPEQAKGSKVTMRSDIYSLGIVLYELVTAEVPFKGENSVSVALKHIEQEPTFPQEINPALPQQLADIILKAIAKDPAERYNSAVEMLKDLREVSYQLDLQQETANQKTMVISKQEEQETKVISKADRRGVNKQEVIKIDSGGSKEMSTEKDKEPNKNSKRSSKKKVIAGLGIILVLFLAVVGLGYYLLDRYMAVDDVEVPNLRGEHVDLAREQLEELGLNLEVYYESYSNEIAEDHIISQSPEPNRMVKENRVISVVTSKGAQMVEAPDLVGSTLREARVELNRLNLEVGELDYEYSDQIPEDEIISQDPEAEEEVKMDTEVDLVISQGKEPEQVIVPEVVGLRQEEAEQKLQDQNLIIGRVIERESLNYRQGRVIAQDPEIGEELTEGATVDLIVSSGIRNVEGAEVKTSEVRTTIQPGPDREVRIVVEDNNGRRVVYEEDHQAGDVISEEVITVGSARIRVYFDGNVVYERTV